MNDAWKRPTNVSHIIACLTGIGALTACSGGANGPSDPAVGTTQQALSGRSDDPTVSLAVLPPLLQHVDGYGTLIGAYNANPSLASFHDDVVVTFSTGDMAQQTIVQTPQGPQLITTSGSFTGLAVSDDSRHFDLFPIPPVAGYIATGDPMVTVDRAGNFYHVDWEPNNATGSVAIIVRTHTHGKGLKNWNPGVVVNDDFVNDKPWIGIGRDPVDPTRDNVYVAWTRFNGDGSTDILVSTSLDQGATFSAPQSIFNFPPAGLFSDAIDAVPYVDPVSGRLYVPFNTTILDVPPVYTFLIKYSDDAGQTFQDLDFKVAGADPPTSLPINPAGILNDCGDTGGVPLIVHAGADSGGGQFGLPRYERADQMHAQPTFAAHGDNLWLAYGSNNSSVLDPAATSDVVLMTSTDRGNTWSAPRLVNAQTPKETQHYKPVLALDDEGQNVWIAYYAQQAADEKLVYKVAVSKRGGPFETVRVSPPTEIGINNLPVPAISPTYTVGFGPGPACSGNGLYQGLSVHDHRTIAVWADGRDSVKLPKDDLTGGSGVQGLGPFFIYPLAGTRTPIVENFLQVLDSDDF